ncbi:putative membrane protein [Lyngbya aestuarii BL J]|uniref:Putative membrane protein n=1 Tax=Lyngbya aestuarii BL J TaxID=1348334 RepID=U7QKE2_9CYAN|nr:hypothetical protein [Lyngbya aestuarii]ERT08368.1 putative membrane protein [Lyngbya aestuarii BL J]
MTPTLLGRWQTRIFLLATVGVLVSLPFWLGKMGKPSWIYFALLGYIALFGLVWDTLYIYLQKFRWDRDWPGLFQLLAGIWEGLFVGGLANTIGLPGISPQTFKIGLFICHYSLVWLTTYLASQALTRILFPHWRFRGGRWF